MGEVVQGTTLEIIKEVKGKVLCECHVCRQRDLYDKAYLIKAQQECRICKEYKRRVSNNDNNRKVAFLINQERKIKENKLKGLKEGLEYIVTDTSIKDLEIGKRTHYERGNSVHISEVIGYIGKYGANGRRNAPDTAVYKCLKCGSITLYTIKEAKVLSGFACPVCSSIVDDNEKLLQKIHEEEINKEKESKSKKLEEQRKKELNKLSKEIAKQQKQKELKQKEIEKVRTEYSNYYVHLGDSSDTRSARIICKLCGTPTTIHHSKKEKCPGCEIKKDNLFYKGACDRDYTDKLFNYLRVIRQYKSEQGFMCDVECIACKKEITGLSVYDVINRKIMCNCGKSNLETSCKLCGAPITIGLSDLSEGITCDSCGNNISEKELRDEAAIEDVSISLSLKAKKLGAQLNYKHTELMPEISLIKEKEPLYVGTDGEEYRRCACIEHNTQMVLSNTEIDNFDHSQCSDSRQHLLKNIDSTTIKLE